MDNDCASPNERLRAAARDDNLDMLSEVFTGPVPFDINCKDGVGNTALHIAVLHGSSDVLDHILSHDGCDVDLINNVGKDTPLHLAVVLHDPEMRLYMVEELLDAGADYTIRNKNGETALDLVRPDDTAVLSAFQRNRAAAAIGQDDIADDDDDDEEGSDVDSGSD